MRINRENTLIENNLQPFSGEFPEDIQAKIVKALTPYKEYVDQLQAALLLKNTTLFGIIVGTVVGLIVLFTLLICSPIPNTIVLIIALPILHLFYCFDAHIRVKKFFIELPNEQNPEDKARLLSLEEIAKLIWKPVVVVARIGFFIYRTYVCPNPVDTIVFIVAAIILGFFLKLILIVFALALVAAVVAPAIYLKVNEKQKTA